MPLLGPGADFEVCSILPAKPQGCRDEKRPRDRGVASEKYLAVVGLGEEDTAHLRLLLRAATHQLEHRWRWGTEDNADLVIVDPTQLAGQIARNRAFSSGRRCAVFSDAEPLRTGEVRLTRPLKSDGLVAVLNGTLSAATVVSSPVAQFKNDFYDVDAFNPTFELEDGEPVASRPQQRETSPAPGLDELLKPDAEARKPQFAVPVKLGADTAIQGGGTSSVRSERRVADSIHGVRPPEEKPVGINLGSRLTGLTVAGDVGAHPLRDYLEQPLLGGPATIGLPGVPALTLDPKQRVFHSAGSLRSLSPYLRQDLPRSAWRTVTTQELARLRTEQPAQPYARLIWLDVLIHADGQLARHLDPGGRYRLKQRPRPDPDFPAHEHIVAAMEVPRKLNEIAAISGASMAEVFDLVTAYDAIGLVEVEQRLPRGPSSAKPSGLLSRLRKSFGRG
jgi:hypothetical protein